MHLFIRTATTAALSLLALAGAHAQMAQQPAPMKPQQPAAQQPAPVSPPQAPAQQPMQQILAKRAEIQQLGAELQEIQDATMDANPELAAQRDELVTLMDTKMLDAGYDATAGREKIENLQGQLQGEELSQEDRQALRAQVQRELSSLEQAQGEAMKDQEVQTKRQALNENLVEAMEEQNPQTEELISDLRSASQEYRQLARQMQQQQGATTPPGR